MHNHSDWRQVLNNPNDAQQFGQKRRQFEQDSETETKTIGCIELAQTDSVDFFIM